MGRRRSTDPAGTEVTSWAEVRDGLKPFQVATAETAFDGLWHDKTTSRFLVADEVGLGKTLVAKGVIAKTIEHLQSLGDTRIDIVYICSNSSIARQNLLKLKEFADGHEESADRLTKLIAAQGLRERGVNVIALTPGTSFTFGHRSGQFDERALLYAVLRHVWSRGADVLASAGCSRVFYYGINADDRRVARKRLKMKADEYDAKLNARGIEIVGRLIRDRNRELREARLATIWDQLRALSQAFSHRGEPWAEDWECRQEVLGELRQIMAQAGVNLLRPDLVIMDEFQRFAELLDPKGSSKASELLRTFIAGEHSHNAAPTKVLLLSATPYRWFDQSGQGSHHSDFLATLSFLHAGDPAPVEAAEQALGNLRGALLPGSDLDAERAAAIASKELRQVMVRTERLSSTPDRNGMLREIHAATPIDQSDIAGYLAAHDLGSRLNCPGVVELWKTSPWIANLGDGYKLTDELKAKAIRGFEWGDDTLLDIESVATFSPLGVPSPRLRWMIERTVGQGWHRLLWMPASRPYYATDNEFDRAMTNGITKQLVFSSWRIAPKAIALGVTYAAEQDIYKAVTTPDTGSDEWAATAYRSQERTLLDLSLTADGVADRATTFLLTAPFSGLAALIDPALLGQRSDGTLRSLEEVRSIAARILTDRLDALGIRVGDSSERGNDWYVFAARILSPADDLWWSSVKAGGFAGNDDKDRRALTAHIAAFVSPSRPAATPPSDLVEVLVDLALSSPAVCALRSLYRTLEAQHVADPALLGASARIGWGFRSLLDTSEVIQIVESDRPYWQAVLAYGAQGNLQAVLDEYLHMLREWKLGGRREASGAEDLAAAAVDALAFRTTTLEVNIPGPDRRGLETRRMRSRFAVRFGDKSSDDDGDRKDVTSAAFNSPFWPFVMATTSIGQEGLDFHLYSHALVHWNLPSDPVALEQREGRVHRFKGHAVRKNVASDCVGQAIGVASEDIWDAMFESVTPAGDSDGIKPYWIHEGDAAVERIVPMLPMSREYPDLERLKNAAATYRMAFGQPRHTDLLEIIDGRGDLPSISLAPRAPSHP